jgi:hypothetical protein
MVSLQVRFTRVQPVKACPGAHGLQMREYISLNYVISLVLTIRNGYVRFKGEKLRSNQPFVIEGSGLA